MSYSDCVLTLLGDESEWRPRKRKKEANALQNGWSTSKSSLQNILFGNHADRIALKEEPVGCVVGVSSAARSRRGAVFRSSNGQQMLCGSTLPPTPV